MPNAIPRVLPPLRKCSECPKEFQQTRRFHRVQETCSTPCRIKAQREIVHGLSASFPTQVKRKAEQERARRGS